MSRTRKGNKPLCETISGIVPMILMQCVWPRKNWCFWKKKQCMWGSRTNWPSYHGNILQYKLYIILKMVTNSIWNNPPNHREKTWWFIEKTTPAYRVQRKKIIGPQDRCALPHCKLQAKILQPPAKQLDSCNRNKQMWGRIQLIQRTCGENQDQHVSFRCACMQ